MRSLRPPGAAPRRSRDAGISLVEVLVAMGLFSLLATLLLGFALSTSRFADNVSRLSNVNEESRLAMERLTRELRQASAVLTVQLPASSTDTTAFTFWTDFNGNGTQDLNAADPEVLTYRWNPATSGLTLTANDASGTAITRPVLAANVSGFSIDLRSSLWVYDTDGDGDTSWRELDAASPPVGNDNDTPDGTELDKIDIVAISMTVSDGSRAQTYRTQVDLRNRNQN